MNKSILALPVLTGLLIACGTAEEITEVEVKEEKEKIKSLVIGDPFDCGIPDMLVFPVGTSYIPEVTGESKYNVSETGSYRITTDGYAASTDLSLANVSTFNFSTNAVSSGTYMWDTGAEVEYVNENQDQDMTNLIFYDMTTGESYPLFEEKLHILSFAIHHEFETPQVFYRVVRDDYNNDSLYNANDPVMLYASELDGSNMKRMTSEGAQFIDYTHYPKFDRILAKTRIDSDLDSAFTAIDETNFTEINFSDSTTTSKEIFSNDLKQMLYDQIGYNNPGK